MHSDIPTGNNTQRHARTERINIRRQKRTGLSTSNQPSILTKDFIPNVKMPKDARSQRFNILARKRKVVEGKISTVSCSNLCERTPFSAAGGENRLDHTSFTETQSNKTIFSNNKSYYIFQT